MAAWPVLTAAAFMGLAASALLVLRPKAFVGLSVLAVLFTPGVRNASDLAILDYTDEAAVMMCLLAFPTMRLITGRGIRWLPGAGWMGLYLAAGLASAFLHDVPLGMAAQSGFLFLKGTLLAFAVAQLDWHASDVARIAQWGAATIVGILFFAAINFAIPDTWAAFTAPHRGGVQYRFGLPSLNGPFGHPVSFGHIMALAAIAVVAYRNTIGRGPISMALMLGTIFSSILSWRRKSFIGMLTGMTAVWLSIARRRGTLLLVLLGVPLVTLLAWDGIVTIATFTYQDYVVNAHQAPRIIMYRDSAGIALRDFPLGAGFGRYGSYLADSNYSPEYVSRGYPAIWGMGTEDDGGFLTDTFWPAILGEAGAVGLVGYTVALAVMVVQGLQLARNTENPAHRFLGILLMAWGAEYLVESFAAPVFSSPPGFVLLFTLIGVVTAVRADPVAGESRAVAQ